MPDFVELPVDGVGKRLLMLLDGDQDSSGNPLYVQVVAVRDLALIRRLLEDILTELKRLNGGQL